MKINDAKQAIEALSSIQEYIENIDSEHEEHIDEMSGDYEDQLDNLSTEIENLEQEMKNRENKLKKVYPELAKDIIDWLSKRNFLNRDIQSALIREDYLTKEKVEKDLCRFIEYIIPRIK